MSAQILDGFELNSPVHIDKRFSFKTEDEMRTYPVALLPIGLRTYCEDTEKNYQWTGIEWKPDSTTIIDGEGVSIDLSGYVKSISAAPISITSTRNGKTAKLQVAAESESGLTVQDSVTVSVKDGTKSASIKSIKDSNGAGFVYEKTGQADFGDNEIATHQYVQEHALTNVYTFLIDSDDKLTEFITGVDGNDYSITAIANGTFTYTHNITGALKLPDTCKLLYGLNIKSTLEFQINGPALSGIFEGNMNMTVKDLTVKVSGNGGHMSLMSGIGNITGISILYDNPALSQDFVFFKNCNNIDNVNIIYTRAAISEAKDRIYPSLFKECRVCSKVHAQLDINIEGSRMSPYLALNPFYSCAQASECNVSVSITGTPFTGFNFITTIGEMNTCPVYDCSSKIDLNGCSLFTTNNAQGYISNSAGFKLEINNIDDAQDTTIPLLQGTGNTNMRVICAPYSRETAFSKLYASVNEADSFKASDSPWGGFNSINNEQSIWEGQNISGAASIDWRLEEITDSKYTLYLKL